MERRSHRPSVLVFVVALALSGTTFAGAADAALAQTSPELEFLNGPITKWTKQGDEVARAECSPPFDAYVETATATAFVLLSGSQEATDVKFETEVPAAGGAAPAVGSLSVYSYEQLVARNQLFVDAEPTENERPDDSVQPSEIKAFALTFYVCSDSKAPAWWYYVSSDSVPIEWSNFPGQLVVRSTGDLRIGPGTVALQLNRPAPGYDGAHFRAIFWISVVTAVVGAAALLFIGRNRLPVKVPKDWKTGLVIPSTAGTAVLGTLVTATILPSDTFFMSKGQYATLNALFGLIVLFVGLMFNNYRNRRLLLIGAGIALGAGTGEAFTIGFVLKEMAFQGSLPGPVTLLQIALLLGWAVLAFLASWALLNRG